MKKLLVIVLLFFAFFAKAQDMNKEGTSIERMQKVLSDSRELIPEGDIIYLIDEVDKDFIYVSGVSLSDDGETVSYYTAMVSGLQHNAERKVFYVKAGQLFVSTFFLTIDVEEIDLKKKDLGNVR